MSKTSKITRLAGFVIVFMTFAMAGGGFFVVRNDVNEMRLSGRENILWDALQIEIELMRFQRQLAKFSAGDPAVTPRSINNRYDILWSRASMFQQGTVGARLRAYDANMATLSALFGKIKQVEPKVVALAAGDRATAKWLLEQLSPFSRDLRRLSRNVLHGEEANHAILRENLSRSSSLLTAISIVSVFASLLLIVIFARETGQFRRLAQLNETLLRASDKASRAKSQFLAMMSHELRTPMNGVLGLIALVKQQGLNAHQRRLLDQAERSGTQMIGLLEDILDFSALQDDRLKLDNKPFEPAHLVDAVRSMFQPVAAREGIDFVARTDASCPERVLGDFVRLRQSLTHLAVYLVETAGTRNIALDMSYEAGCLNSSISFDYNQEGGEWTPELIMGNSEQNTNSFASEALGPAVSRGLIKRMGGTTKLDTPGDNRIAVLVSVPAKELVVDILLIRIACQSTALEAICKAALRSENVRFLPPESLETPHVVMIEAGGVQESTLFHSYVQLYPDAILVALGRPQNPDIFDDVVDVPIDIATIRQAGFMQLAKEESPLAGNRQVRYAHQGNAT